MASPLRHWYESFPRYQLRWMFDEAQVALAIKARQIGFSFATAAGAVRGAYLQHRPQLILSASRDLSREVLAKARGHCEFLGKLGLHSATDWTTDNSHEIAWRSGGRIVALPASPRSARSYSGDVWLDEFAYHKDPESIRDGAFPMASRGGWRIKVISTPDGAGGLFYDWATKPPLGWSIHRVTIEDAIADGFEADPEKLMELAGGDPRIFSQWYQCSFLDNDMQYIPSELIEAATTWVGRIPSLEGADVYAGLDVGRTVDLTALCVIAVVEGVAYVVAMLTCPRTKFSEQRKLIEEAREAFGWQQLLVDSGGIGAQFVEELVEAWGPAEVKPMYLNGGNHRDGGVRAGLASGMLRWLRDGRLKLPRGQEGKLISDEMRALRRKISTNNSVVYEVQRGRGGHGDRLWATALALYGARGARTARGVGSTPLMAVG